MTGLFNNKSSKALNLNPNAPYIWHHLKFLDILFQRKNNKNMKFAQKQVVIENMGWTKQETILQTPKTFLKLHIDGLNWTFFA